jgi:flagellin-specific chaperone FliS
MKRSEVQHIHELLHAINFKVNIIMANMQDLIATVQDEASVDDSIITLLDEISQQLKDAQAQNDPAAIQGVIDSINANKQKISDAVTRNTPAQPIATQTATQQ